jgi:hypothetical protein
VNAKRFLSHKGLASRDLGDWSLSATATLQSGSPYTARILGSSINNSGTGLINRKGRIQPA